jgi:hypothetical protein
MCLRPDPWSRGWSFSLGLGCDEGGEGEQQGAEERSMIFQWVYFTQRRSQALMKKFPCSERVTSK